MQKYTLLSDRENLTTEGPEIGLFAKANPSRDMTKFMIGAPGKAAVPLKAQ